MNSRLFTVFALLCLVLAACHFKHKKSVVAVVKNVPPVVDTTANFPMVDSASIFDHETTEPFWASTTQNADEYARKLYLNAIDVFANKKDAKASLPLFLKSLRVSPVAGNYLKYADALYAAGEYEQASLAYSYNENNDDTSLIGNVYMGLARCSAMMGDSSTALDQLEKAFESYPFDIKVVESDTAFQKLGITEELKVMLATYIANETSRKIELVGLFANNFPKAGLPYSIQADSLMTGKGNEKIDYEWGDFITGMTGNDFSRDVSKDYQYVAELNLKAPYKSFVYRSLDMEYMGDDIDSSLSLLPIHYYLLTLDSVGTKKGEQEVACWCGPFEIQTLNIGADGLIKVDDIEQTWKNDPRKKGYMHNKVVKREVRYSTYYMVAADGSIVETKEPGASNE